jgi:hypothetical protein
VGLCILVLFLLLQILLNSAPKVRSITVADASTRPLVIKVHARWCPVCMATKGAWSKLQKSYEDRANFLVFDLTTSGTKAESEAEARRLGVDSVFESHSSEPGVVLVMDGASKQVRDTLPGMCSFEQYSASLEQVLAGPKTPTNAPLK